LDEKAKQMLENSQILWKKKSTKDFGEKNT
jgi:hypothetical protein